MNKEQAIYSFWASFGVAAYDENSVPTGDQAPAYPYITYNVITDSLDNDLPLTANIWYFGTSWEDIALKTAEIARSLAMLPPIPLDDGGYLWLKKGTPFAQRLESQDDNLRRMYLNVTAEFLTAY